MDAPMPVRDGLDAVGQMPAAQPLEAQGPGSKVDSMQRLNMLWPVTAMRV